MKRTQVYLSDDEIAFLDRAAEQTGASRSELIRRAVTVQYGGGIGRSNPRLDAVQGSAGAWRGQVDPRAGADEVEQLREGFDDRFARFE